MIVIHRYNYINSSNRMFIPFIIIWAKRNESIPKKERLSRTYRIGSNFSNNCKIYTIRRYSSVPDCDFSLLEHVVTIVLKYVSL